MKSTSASVSRLALILVILAMSLTSTVLMNGQEAQAKQAKGVPVDWTHQHVVFSNPGSADEAIRNGTYERWLKISTDPRYIMQQQKRSANASSAALQHGSSQDALNDATQDVPPDASAAKPVALEPRAEQADARVQAYEEDAGTIEMSLEEREAARVGNRRLPSGLVRAIMPPIKQADSPQAAKKKKRNRIKKDWSENLGSNGTTGLGEFPAIYTTGGTDCNDFAVFNTGLPGAAGPGGQANIIAYNNLYTGCPGRPTVYWAYNTGGTVFNSVVLSYDSKQVAFVQSSPGGVASLVLLKWKAASVTLTTPVTLTAVAAPNLYNGCTAPCMTTFTFSGSPNDSYSAPFVDYGTNNAYVGDDAGKLHKFTNIFASGANTPGEAPSPWPVTVNANASLGSPVYDTGSTHVFVGDYLLSSSSGCEPSATKSFSPCGYLYSLNVAGLVLDQSEQLDFNFGIMDGPIVDPSAGEVYVFAGDDGSTNCGKSTPCAAVYQLTDALAVGNKATVGPGYEFMMSGTFDNAYFNSSSSKPTGNLYVIGNTGPANNTLYQIPINSNVMSTTAAAGPAVSSNYTNGYYAAGLQVAEFDNGTNDYIFLSVLAFGAPFGSAACGTATLVNGCVIGYDVTSGTITASTTPTGGTAEAGGTSGIVVDSGAAGAQNIYFSTLLNGTCTGGPGGCAIQTSQSAP